ncbi:granzyme-like protein 1 [Triplophysa rosa]|uniref:trypsin n=1 Tax=Triplophysa rosa TaxID=992332 RepID=A0A9W7T6D2_TRIRA|nr:granzyme-like protein 1 [Triplophysa rosa]KAI7791096.1 putative mast cell protease 2 [Triplophysa rosa]
MNICWFITILLLLHSCNPGDGMDHGIVGGHVSVPHSRPYMVYIQDSRTKSACDGFLVREDFVMTAAHCKKSHLKVYLGVSDTTLLPTGIEVDSFPHSSFENKPGNDIMLLKLKTRATLNKTVTIIDLPNPWNDKILKDCLVMGWGSTKYDHYSPSTVLRELNVTLKDLTNCFEPDVICNEDPFGPSQGDSGGPLICGGIAMGIVSFHMKKTEGYLTAYTRVSQHLQWINEIMKKNNI